ncbi:TetR/AcrR family transcriptional regulator [Planctomicrobium sp. SH664]|uniref:TetR/AcrR family transcriptional regulator n=1 Tax=Planctomicrobium sp. SH664 TaxID=3448125 RepID=UPI003F5B3263
MTASEPVKRDPLATRQLLLDVAGKCILEKGLAGMTLDSVAREAGVSKGGLLHHFPSKQHLIDALIVDLHQQFLEKWKRSAEADPEEAGRYTRAYLKISAMERDKHACKLCNIIAVEDRANRTMRDLWRRFLSSLLNPESSGGADPVMLAIVQLATDGLWLAEMEGVFAEFPELRQQVIERLYEMTRTQPLP